MKTFSDIFGCGIVFAESSITCVCKYVNKPHSYTCKKCGRILQ